MAKLPDQDIESARSDILAVVERYVELEAAGSKEYRALCPFHSENSPSFTVTPGKGRFHCFGCGAAGTAIDFVMQYEAVDFRTAVQIINKTVEAPEHAQPRERVTIERDEPTTDWQPMPLVPADAPAPKDVINRKIAGKWYKLPTAKRWEYRDAAGALIGYIYRFNLPPRPDGSSGGKEVIPQTYCIDHMSGEVQWQWLSFGKPRPLYGLDLLAANPKAQVLVVEGEKDCDAARALFGAAGVPVARLVVVAWPGGGKAVPHVDWSPMFGRKVALWPDADQKPYKERHPRAGQLMPVHEQPGFVAMRDIHDVLLDHCEAVKFIAPPAGVPDGWGLADELPPGFDLMAHMKTGQLAADVFAVVPEPEPEAAPPWDDAPATSAPSAPATPPKPAVTLDRGDARAEEHDKHEDPALGNNGHFRVLGYDHERYYILQYEKCQIMTYTKSDFSEAGLIELAPLDWWELNFAGDKGGINKKMAMNWIVRKAGSRGVYDMERIRGRGAWTDKGRSVFHHGGHLTVDGEYCDITELKSRYVYEMAKPLPEISDVPLSCAQGQQLLDLASEFSWHKPASAALLAGWIALAPVGGAINWRPHVWITGGAGSGKAQPHTAKVLTPSGWREMGDLVPGDYVRTPDNSIGKVIGKFPQGVQPVYKLTFADGRVVRATGDHLWKVRVKHAWRLRTTLEMIDILARESRGSISLAVPLAEPLDIVDNRKTALPIHPYALGALLGDGTLGSIAGQGKTAIGLTSADPEIFRRVAILAPGGAVMTQAGNSISYRFRDKSAYGKSMRTLIDDLRLLGTRSHNKFIPAEYLNASIDDRFELLKGLMDTDGTVCTGGSTSYCSVSKQLALDVQYLVRSLGGAAMISEKNTTYTHKGEKLSGQLAYNVSIRFKNRSKLFNLGRKLERVIHGSQYDDCLYLGIDSIERDGEEECSCIAIDHPDRLYVTDDFTVTHNTTVLGQFVNHLMNGIRLFAQGNSSEAGIRQKLKSDALPVLFDESESATERDSMRIQSVLSMVRQASTESQAETYKGTAGGDAMSFHIRSMFCLASIQVGIKYQADIERMTVLGLRSSRDDPNAEGTWERIKEALHIMHKDEHLPARLVRRSLNMLPVTLRNITVFSKAAAMRFGSQRDGDQYGTLLAGAWSLKSDGIATIEDATAMIAAYDWSEHRENNEVDEGERALAALMGALIRIHGGAEVTVNELIRYSQGQEVPGVTLSTNASAEAVLQRHGMRCEGKMLVLSNTSTELKRLLEGTPFEADVKGALMRVRGAEKYPRTIKFNGITARAIQLPMDHLLTDDIDPPADLAAAGLVEF